MNELNERLIRIEQKLDTLIAVNCKRTRKVRANSTTKELDRPQEMMRIFNSICSLSDQKKARQHFPEGTYSMSARKGHIEIVPRAILRNRASMRSIFRPTKEEFMKYPNASDIADFVIESLIEQGKLVESSLEHTNLKTDSRSVCVFSPRWAAIAEVAGFEGVVEEETEDDRIPLHEFLKAHSKPVVPSEEREIEPVEDVLRRLGKLPAHSPKNTQKPLESPPMEQERLSEEEIIRQMQESERESLLDDDDEVFQTKKTKKKIEL